MGVSVHDITGKLTYANPTAKQLMGIDTLPDATTEKLATAYLGKGTEFVIEIPVICAIAD